MNSLQFCREILINTKKKRKIPRLVYRHPFANVSQNAFKVGFLNLRSKHFSCRNILVHHRINRSWRVWSITSDAKIGRKSSVFDLRQWCEQHQHSSDLHSTFIPYHTVNSIDDVFIFFTTKQLFQQLRFTTYLQVDATYKITWNDLPLLVFGSSDANRRFRPFGIALVSSDEGSQCYEQLFSSINSLSVNEFNQPCLVNQIMADGARGMFSYVSLSSE